MLPDVDATANFDVNSWYKKGAHDDWVKSVETILGQIEVANASTAPVVLSPAQRQAKLFAQVANEKEYLTEVADSLLTSLDNVNTISKPLLDREERDSVNWEEHKAEESIINEKITPMDIDLSTCVFHEEAWPAFIEAEEIAKENPKGCDRELFAMDNTTKRRLPASIRQNLQEIYYDALENLVKAATYVKEEVVDCENIVAKMVIFFISIFLSLWCRMTMVTINVTSSLAQYFSNRINEPKEKINSWGKIMDMDVMEETELDNFNCSSSSSSVLVDRLHYTPKEFNAADLATREETKIEDKMEGVAEGADVENVVPGKLDATKKDIDGTAAIQSKMGSLKGVFDVKSAGAVASTVSAAVDIDDANAKIDVVKADVDTVLDAKIALAETVEIKGFVDAMVDTKDAVVKVVADIAALKVVADIGDDVVEAKVAAGNAVVENPSDLNKINRIIEMLYYSESWLGVKGIMARLMKATVMKDKRHREELLNQWWQLWYAEKGLDGGATYDDHDEGGQVDITEAATEDLRSESDVISNLRSVFPSHDSDLLSIVTSYDSDILPSIPSRNSTATNWSDIDKDKGDKIAINVDNVTGDEVDEEEKDLQKGLNKLST